MIVVLKACESYQKNFVFIQRKRKGTSEKEKDRERRGEKRIAREEGIREIKRRRKIRLIICFEMVFKSPREKKQECRRKITETLKN